MSLKIDPDLCINCAACIDECPVDAIVDEDDNPTRMDVYYIYPRNCIECVGYYDVPACYEACPVKKCIRWGDVLPHMPYSPLRCKTDKTIAL